MRKFLFCCAITFVMFGCKKETDTTSAKTYKVKYNIGCTDCTVIYVADTSGTQQTAYHQNSSWTYTFNGKQNQELLLLAYNTSNAPQGVNVKIAVNDSVLTDRTTYCAISGVSFAADTIR